MPQDARQITVLQEIPGLLEHGQPTDIQREKLETLQKHGGSYTRASKATGLHPGNYRQAVEALRKRAAMHGWSPKHDMTHVAPPTHNVIGTSTLYDSEGNIRLQWNKTHLAQDDKYKQMKAFAEEVACDLTGRAKKTKAPKIDTKDLLAIYPQGDPHIGMYAWGEETGEDFDVDIGVRDLCRATERLVDTSPACETAVILNLGDFFHADNMQNMTTRSGNILDVDTRWSRVMRLGAAAMKSCIDTALQKHRKVIVRNCIGNHDDHTSQALALILDAYYSKEPRVKVDISPNPFWYFRFGLNLVAATHGHTVKPADLASIMAHDRPKDWGDTVYRYWYLGHYHTQKVHETGSVVTEYFRTLAAKDAWTNEHGYRSGRDMNSIILHKDYGQIERHRADILMVRA